MAATTFDLAIWIDGQDVPLEIRADQRDMAAFEVETGKSSLAALSDTPMSFFRYLGVHAAKRQRCVPEGVSFEDWCETVIEVEPADEETPDPGKPAASEGTSSK